MHPCTSWLVLIADKRVRRMKSGKGIGVSMRGAELVKPRVHGYMV